MSNVVQARNAEMTKILDGEYQRRWEPNFAWVNVLSSLCLLHGARGVWLTSSVDENADVYDSSMQGRSLSYYGNPTYNLDGLAPYIDLDGAGDYLSRPDESGLDILGTEAYMASPGLTLGGWFWTDASAGALTFMAKWAAANQLSYRLRLNASYGFSVTTDGSTVVTVSSAETVANGVWKHIVGRFVPSTSLDIWVNGQKDTLAVGVPASVFSSTSALTVGYNAVDGVYLDGRASCMFLCAAALSDVAVFSIYQQQRAMFGV